MPSKPSGLLTIILGIIVLACIAAATYLQASTSDVASWLVGFGSLALGGLVGVQVPAPSQQPPS